MLWLMNVFSEYDFNSHIHPKEGKMDAIDAPTEICTPNFLASSNNGLVSEEVSSNSESSK